MAKKALICFVFVLVAGLAYGQTTAIYKTTSTDSAGWDRDSDTTNPPPSPLDASWQALDSAALTAMGSQDTSRKETKRTTDQNQFDSQLYRFVIAQDRLLVTKIDLNWVGYGEATALYPCYLYIWNLVSGAWELVDTEVIGTPDGTLSGSITTDITDYINIDGTIFFVAQAKHYNYASTVTQISPPSGQTYDSWDVDGYPPIDVGLSWSQTDLDRDGLVPTAVIRRNSDLFVWTSGAMAEVPYPYAAPSSWNQSLYGQYAFSWWVTVNDGIVDTQSSTWGFTIYNSIWSCCPMIYVWDGDEFKYITDSARGYAPGIQKKRRFDKRNIKPKFSVLESEYIVLGQDLAVKDGCYEVKFREILNEITYLDEAGLVAIEHPEGYEVASSAAGQNPPETKLPPIPTDRFYLINKDRKTPLSVSVEGVGDVLDAVSAVDDNVLSVDGDSVIAVIDFGEIEESDANLVLEGWRYLYTARSERRKDKDNRRLGSYIELMGNDGNWEKVSSLGMFLGDFKAMVIPIGDALKNRKDHRIRLTMPGKNLSTTLNIIDRISLDTTPRTELKPIELKMESAELSFKGLARTEYFNNPYRRMRVDDSTNMIDPDLVHTGNFTRYGDVEELLLSSDNHFVIMGAGDQTLMRFSKLDEPAKGMIRTFALRTSLCFREGKEPNEIKTVDPLPFIGVKDYPYEPGKEEYPMTEANKAYLAEYNTRVISNDDIRVARRQYNEQMLALANLRKPVPRSLNTNYVTCTVTYTDGGTAPTVPTPALPEDEATGLQPAVTIRWDASSGTAPITYRLQVATDVDFLDIVQDSSGFVNNFFVIDLTGSTTYYWRVCADNPFGTSIWSTVRSFTTGIFPSVPTPSLPSNASTDIALAPTFEWSSSTGTAPIYYTMQIDTEDTFADPLTLEQDYIFGNTYTITTSLSEASTYFWRVKATNSIASTAWSATFSFTTGSKPSAPALVVPADASIDATFPLVLDWDAATGSSPITYTIQVDDNVSFGSTNYNQGNLTSTVFALPTLSSSTTYYWRVSATNHVGTGDWSDIYSFTTAAAAAAPSIPVISTPANAAEFVSINAVLAWATSTGSGPITYRMQISTDSGYASPTEVTTLETWSLQSALSYNTTYYWRVRAENAIGTSTWATASFTTKGSSGSDSAVAPTVPTPSLPANGATELSLPVSITWVPSSGSTPLTYTVEIATDEAMTDVVFTDAAVTDSFTSVEFLSLNATYYWRVKATNAYGESAWSAVIGFTTGGSGYAQIAVSPGNLSYYVEKSATADIIKKITVSNAGTLDFTWTLSENANWLSLVTSSGTTIAPTVIDCAVNIVGLAVGTYSATITVTAPDAVNTPYSVPITLIVYDNSSTGGTGGTGTTLTVPGKPVLATPTNGEAGIYPAPILTWQAVTGATGYWVQISSNLDFSTLAMSKSTSEVFIETSGLVTANTYYWRVRSSNAAGSSDWSEPWTFQIKGEEADGGKKSGTCFLGALMD